MKSTAHRLSRLVSTLGAVVGLALPAVGEAAYVMTSIDIAGATNTAVWDINNSGTMVGYSTSGPSDLSTAFVRSAGGTVTTLGPAGAVSSVATGISETGLVVGSYSSTLVDDGAGNLVAGPSVGFIYAGSTYTTFAVAGAIDTFLRAVSSDGRYLSGYYSTDTVAGVGFVYDTLTATTTIVSRPDSLLTIAQGVNNSGTLVGGDIIAGSPTTRPGFTYDIGTGTRTDVQLAGASRTALRAIDEAGTLAGWFIDGSAATHGFIGSLTDYELIDFAGATSTFVEGSNDARWVVGEWIDASGVTHGYVAMTVPAPGSLALALTALLVLRAGGPWRGAAARRTVRPR